MKARTYKNGQKASEQKGDKLTYCFKNGIVRARVDRLFKRHFEPGCKGRSPLSATHGDGA